MALRVVPCTITDARIFVERHHSHHHAPVGGLCAVAVADETGVVCVAILSRPVARAFDRGTIAEVTRVASTGVEHAASKCVAAISRAALALGYTRLVSSILLGEAGTSYRAAGWWPTHVGEAVGEKWHSRTGRTVVQPGAKVRWEFGPDALPRDPDVDARVRAAVGVVEVGGRPETLPLLMALEP